MVKCSVLLILDDVIGDGMLKKNGNVVQRLAVNGRHVTRGDPLGNEFCCIVVSQRSSAVPPIIRNNADIWFSSRLASRKEIDYLTLEALCLSSSREGISEARDVYDRIVHSAPYRFICVCAYKAERMTHKDYCSSFTHSTTGKPTHLINGVSGAAQCYEGGPPSACANCKLKYWDYTLVAPLAV